jgi:hypothetical protein
MADEPENLAMTLPPAVNAFIDDLIERVRATASHAPGEGAIVIQCSLVEHLRWLRTSLKLAMYAVKKFEEAGARPK